MYKPVTVVGSYNLDQSLKCKALPHEGETVIAQSYSESSGGKGSNQAVAASKMGAKTRFIGRIGADHNGQDALAMYDRLDIDRSRMVIDECARTGLSVIMVDENGRNQITVVPGANYNLSKADIDASLDVLCDSGIVGFQLENQPEVVAYGLKKVSGLGVKTLLDPAPAFALPQDLYQYIYCIKPNEHEAKALTGIPVSDFESACKAGKWFLDRGVQVAIITLGSEGSVLVTKNGGTFFNTPKVNAVDTTGAGDCFSGALMASIAQDKSIEESILLASHAAALSVTKFGVIDSIPTLAEVEAFIKTQEH